MPEDLIDLYETTIDELREAFAHGSASCVEVAAKYLNRIGAFDRSGARLNSVIVLNPNVFEEAAESDGRWQNGTARPLEGIPFTVKDSYMVQGLTVAAGSPAFADLIAQWDAFSVAQLREAGAVFVGKTNMPPMADGGMQRGLYGRAESPYNPTYLSAAYASGSSNGSGVATAANFSVFGMGEETVSSGRSPASNNALCAYTPSWGMISIRGNWPLFPARDVVVPHTRNMRDMLHVVNALVHDDETPRGDFWRSQNVIEIPPASKLRPVDYQQAVTDYRLDGKTFGVPKMYLGKDPNFPIDVRASILEIWEDAKIKLESLGARVIEVDFPLIEQYEGDKPAGENIGDLGVLPDGWMETEFNHFLSYGWDDFLRANADPNIPDLAAVDPDMIFPLAPGTLPDRYEEVDNYEERYRATVSLAQNGISDPRKRDDFAPGLRALVQLREELFENWLHENKLDAVVFPANADIGTEAADFDQNANDHAWENGVLFSNGNYALRHFGIPTVTVPMGTMNDIGMPVGLTFAGNAYDDTALLGYATQFNQSGSFRTTPAFAPSLVSDIIAAAPESHSSTAEADPIEPEVAISEIVTISAPDGALAVSLSGDLYGAEYLEISVNGTLLPVEIQGDIWVCETVVAPQPATRNPIGDSLLIVACAKRGRRAAAEFIDLPCEDEPQ